MKQLTLALKERAYDIWIQRGLLGRLGELARPLLDAKKLLVVTDSRVSGLYAARVLDSLAAAGFETALVTVPEGEGSKTPVWLEALWKAATDLGLSRNDGLVALGGGVVGDLTGFAAATLYRGVDYIQVPTTLLAQVDSAIGGKTGIDLPGGKNLAGAFWQPRGVFIDPDCLDTLPDPVFADGMAEVIKYGCIRSRELFDRLARWGGRTELREHMEELLEACCGIKAQLVSQDEYDRGSRMLLNFGHTLGHGYEYAGGFSAYTHGQAVAAGMCAAVRLGQKLGLTPGDTLRELEALLRVYGLPTALACDPQRVAAALGLDKKAVGEHMTVILLSQIGQARLHRLDKEQVLLFSSGG